MPTKEASIVPQEIIASKIFVIRGKKIMLDRDLAELYGVETKRLNEQVKRNKNRFPEDFMFQLTKKETAELVAICDRFKTLKHSTSLPYAFTEYGALMLANVIKSSTAIETSITIVRTFSRLREMLATHADLKKKIEKLEEKYDKHDEQFKLVFEAVRQLLEPPDKPTKEIGFRAHSD